MTFISKWIITLLLMCIATITFAQNNRQLFLTAISNLKQGKQQQFLQLANQLKNYPLYPYLVYQDIALHLPQASSQTITNFINTYQQTPLAERLRKIWLIQLFQQQRWQEYLQFYRPQTALIDQCEYQWVLQKTGKNTGNFTFPVGVNLPPICISLLKNQPESVRTNFVWQQIIHAYQHKDFASVQFYTNLLTPLGKKRFLLWQQVNQNPEKLFLYWSQIGSLKKPIITTAFQQLANHDPNQAILLLKKMRHYQNFDPNDQQIAIRVIAIALAEQRQNDAGSCLALIKPMTPEILIWRIRVALYQQQWSTVTALINQLPKNLQSGSQWRYWSARALSAQDHILAARDIYRHLAVKGDFYGQLASVQLHQTPLFALKQYQVNQAQIKALANLPALQRAYKLYQLGWLTQAHEEWQWALDHMSSSDYLTAAELAIQWGWYNQAILSLNKITNYTSLSLRYPLAYQTSILSMADKAKLNPAWVFALIRQESLFSPDIRSSAGALGLMQILPSTGNLISHQLGVNFMPQSLLQPNFNLLIGSIYLKRLLMRFHGNIILATAAYNAGPGRVKQWIGDQPLPVDIWIETIPWHETRDYVKNITMSTTFYEKALGLPFTLTQRLTKE